MSNKTQLQTNNTKYAALIETLRSKAVGGGNASVQTTSVTIDNENVISNGYGVDVYLTRFVDGQIVHTHQYVDAFQYVYWDDVVVGSLIVLDSNGFYLDDTTNMVAQYSCTNSNKVYCYTVGDGAYFMFLE